MMELSVQNRRSGSTFAGLVGLVGLVVLSFLQLQMKQMLHTRGRFHAWGHICCFAFVQLLLAAGMRTLRSRLICAGAMMGFGCAIEIVQNLLYGQSLEVFDILIDALGVIVGLVLVLVWDHLRSTPRISLRQRDPNLRQRDPNLCS